MDQIDPITSLVDEGIRTGTFPGAVLFVRHHGQIRIHQAFGSTSSVVDSPSVDIQTIYDLASLTKPLATASSILLLIQDGRLNLSQKLETLLEETHGSELGEVPLKDFLSHQSGLPAWRPLYQAFSPSLSTEIEFRPNRRQTILEMIVREPIARSSPSSSVYSDLGYILLGLIVERVTGQTLEEFCQDRIFRPLQATPLAFGLPKVKGDLLTQISPTEDDPWRGRLLQGEVHDENAAVLGGMAGHAGLFGTANAVGRVSTAWLDGYAGRSSLFQQEWVRQFVTPQPKTSWALGWDTPTQPSSSGQWFSPASFGHLGFTGTSLWIDPIRELEVVFLSNRVHPTRENQAIKTFRPKLHDAIIHEFQ